MAAARGSTTESGANMISVWWIVAAFIGGGFAGMLVVALMTMARDMPKQASHVPDFDVTA